MTLTEIIARIKLLWSERDSMGYVIDFQENYNPLKMELADAEDYLTGLITYRE